MRADPEGYAWSRFGQPEYTDWLDESLSWKQTCYIGDWSFLWQHRITGPDALQPAERLRRQLDGVLRDRPVQTRHPHGQHGKVIHEGVLTRFGEEEFMVHGRGGFWLKFNADRGTTGRRSRATTGSSSRFPSPSSIKVLQKLDPSDALLEHSHPRRAAARGVARRPPLRRAVRASSDSSSGAGGMERDLNGRSSRPAARGVRDGGRSSKIGT